MAPKSKKTPKLQAHFKVILHVYIPLTADDLEPAVAEAAKLNVAEALDLNWNHNISDGAGHEVIDMDSKLLGIASVEW